MKIGILLITLSLGLGLVTTIARAQSAPSVITPTFTTTTTAGHTSFGIGPSSTIDPAYSDATAFTTGHYTSSGSATAATSWAITFTYVSTGTPTFVSGSYNISDYEEADAWASIDGPSGYADAYGNTPLTDAYDYEPGGPTGAISPNTTTYSSTTMSASGVTWVDMGAVNPMNPTGPHNWQGSFVFTTTNANAYAIISRTYSGSSGDGAELDTYIEMTPTLVSLNVTTH